MIRVIQRLLSGGKNKVLSPRSGRFRSYSRLRLEHLEPRLAPAGLPVFLKDVFADNSAGNSDSRAYAEVNNVVLFAGRTRQNNQNLGVELWSTAGTPATTVLLKDINPGAADGLNLSTVEFVRLGNRVFFSANDGSTGFELWQSDGTVAGTVRVRDINPGAGSSNPNNLKVVGNKILFWANNGVNGNELWITDGTTNGTQLVKDINPGPLGSDPQNVTVIGSKIYFGGLTQTQAIEPWVSDGTANGTFLLQDINPGPNSSDPAEFTEVNGIVVFSAFQPTTGREIWGTNGTSIGTNILRDIVSGSGSSNPTQLTKVGSTVYFIANDDIYLTNGAAAGTILVTATPYLPNYLYNFNGQLVFESDVFNDPTTLRLWSVNGNVATVFASIARNPTATTRFFGWLNIGNKLIFAHDDGVRGFEPWVTDLTQNGTFNLRNIRSGAFDGLRESDFVAGNFAVVGNVAYFVASDNTNNFELWSSNGTSAGTLQVADVNPGNFSSNPNNLTVIGTRMYLTMTQSVPTGSPAATGAEPYVMDVSNTGGSGRGTDIIGRQNASGQWFLAASTGSSFTTTQVGLWSGSAAVTWVDVMVGDFNGDGLQDVIGRWAQTGQWWVGISNGSGIINQYWSAWSAGTGVTWADVQVGDFNGDGRSDIIGRWAQTGQWWVGISNGSQFNTSLWSVWTAAQGVTWADVRVGDFNGDGRSDIAGRWNEAGHWYVGLSNGVQFSTSYWGAWTAASSTVTWVDVLVGDLNGDNRDDVIGRINQTGQWYAGIATGVSFATQLFATWAASVTWVDLRMADFNGDGRMDIVGRNAVNGQLSVGLSTGTALNTTLWGTWSFSVQWVDVVVGDFNGDGFADVAGRNQATGAWQVSRSNGTSTFTTSNWGGNWATGVTWASTAAIDFNFN